MALQVIPNDVQIQGNLYAQTLTLPAGAISDGHVNAAAAIQASKMQHQHIVPYDQESATTAVSEARTKHVVKGATAQIVEFAAGAVVPLTGADTCTVDLKKNGTSILSAPIALAAGDTVRGLKVGTLASTTAVAGDWFEVVVTATHTSGTLPKGVSARLTIREDAQ